jgi:hypothetical protein
MIEKMGGTNTRIRTSRVGHVYSKKIKIPKVKISPSALRIKYSSVTGVLTENIENKCSF